MVTHPGAGGVRPFLKLVEVQALRGAADRDLLRRFAAARDEAAFRVIAERHGPMVFGVCARLLGNRHDAEDALQATFLVFAQRAGCVRNSESLASWLHGVARRVATRLRRTDHRRAAREHAAAMPEPRPPADPAWSEVRAGLDEELARLPDSYREVLVLCYLEGLTRDEAGQRLGIDAGAVKGRLERGRRLLGERLVKRGIGLSVGLAGFAAAPPLTAALRVGRLAADPAAASPRAAVLTHDFLKGVAMSKIKFVTAGLVGAAVLAVGIGVTTAQSAVQPPPVAQPKQPLSRTPGEKVAPAPDTDEAFIRRVSKDLRGTDPTPAEVHFFLSSKDANKRATLVDLFVKEKADKAPARALGRDDEKLAELDRDYRRAAAEALLREAVGRRDAERQRADAEQARAAAERVRAAAEALSQKSKADQAAAEAKLREQIESLHRELAKLQNPKDFREKMDALERELAKKGFRVPPTPALKGLREVEPVDPARPAPPAPPAAPSKAAPAAPKVPPPPAPGLPPTARVAPVPVTPPAPPAPPAASLEALRIQVQLAELNVREKEVRAKQAEAAHKTGALSAADLDLAKIELQRAHLQLREVQLKLEAAPRSRPDPRPEPRPDPRPDPRPIPSPQR